MVESRGRRGPGEEAEAVEIIGADQMNCKCCTNMFWFYSALILVLFDSPKVFQRGKKNIQPLTWVLGA